MADATAIELERQLPFPPAAVWAALTEPGLHARWWAAGDVRPVPGHRFELDMGAFGAQACEVLAVEPERLFSIRFAVGQLDSTLTWRLTPAEDGTRLGLVHGGFNLEQESGRRALAGMGRGWPSVLQRLAALLEAEQ
ncbi:MAG: SRPBCC domain-containing protein [Myxococcales bacterium]|nr:SRPBCC domain-containing protein [Myxococcales bacterium]